MLVVPTGVLRTVPCGMLSLRAESAMGSCPRGRLWEELCSCSLPDAEEVSKFPSPIEFVLSSWSQSSLRRLLERWVSVDCSSIGACGQAFGRG